MSTNHKQAANATVDDHLRNMISIMKRGAHVTLSGIPDDLTFLSSHFAGDYAKAMAEKIEAALFALPLPLEETGCEMCGGRGEIGGHRGQTAESYEEYSEPCPDCTTKGFLFNLVTRLRKIPVNMGVDGHDIDRLLEIAREAKP